MNQVLTCLQFIFRVGGRSYKMSKQKIPNSYVNSKRWSLLKSYQIKRYTGRLRTIVIFPTWYRHFTEMSGLSKVKKKHLIDTRLIFFYTSGFRLLITYQWFSNHKLMHSGHEIRIRTFSFVNSKFLISPYIMSTIKCRLIWCEGDAIGEEISTNICIGRVVVK